MIEKKDTEIYNDYHFKFIPCIPLLALVSANDFFMNKTQLKDPKTIDAARKCVNSALNWYKMSRLVKFNLLSLDS